MQAHKNVIKKLISKKDKFFIPNSITQYFANILEQTKDIWDILESLTENIRFKIIKLLCEYISISDSINELDTELIIFSYELVDLF